MIKVLSGKWPFYVNGVLIALTVILGLYLFDDSLGMSDGMTVISEFCKESVKEKKLAETPPLDWQTGFLIGIFIGALAAAISSGQWKFRITQGSDGGFFRSFFDTVIYSLGGGFLVMLGLQVGGDTFFGQWAAAMQMSAGSWIFLIAFFATAVLIAIVLERRKEGSSGKE
jgi:hypothetical protein